MKIVVLSSHTPSLFWFRLEMMQLFIDCGYEVIAVGNENENDWKDKFSEVGILYRQVQIQRNGMNPIKDLQALKSYKNLFKKEKPDKIFAYQAKSVIYGAIAANKLGISEVYPLIAGVGSVFLSNDIKSKLIRTILKAEYKISLKHCPKIFFQNDDDVSIFIKDKITNNNKIVMLNGSGVNLEKYTVQPLPQRLGFLCISRLIKDKGIFEYLKACQKIKQKYPHVRCLLVGPYDSNPTAIKEKDLEPYINDGSIEYYGEQSDVRPYLAQCNVFVLPSYREGMPKTVLEAMASYKAIITTDTPGCRETVNDGENGFLIPPKDVDSLVNRMEYFINNTDIISHMANAGRQIAEKKFDVKQVNEVIKNTMNL